MKKQASFLLGLIPLACGWILNYVMMLPFFNGIMLFIVNAGLLFLWSYLAYRTRHFDRSALSHTLKMNTVGLIFLALVLIQQLSVGHYWPNVIGLSAQFYFLPCLSLGYRIEGLFSPLFQTAHGWVVFALVFVLMFAASYIGSRMKKR